MVTFPDIGGSVAVKLESIATLAERGQAHLDARQPFEARECFALALAQARAAGVDSPFLTWKLAVAIDGLGELEEALRYAIRAVRLDPFSLPFIHSQKVIARRVRDALTDEGWSAMAPETARLYGMLLQIGEATPPCHVVMSKHYSEQGRLEEARKLLDAASLLFPGSEDVWLAKARTFRALGDDGAAREAEAVAAACGARPAFPVATA